MRQEWSPEELLASWTLVDGDWELVANKSGATWLGFSLLLKFFELEGRFPDVLEEVPPAGVEYVADLVKVPATNFAKYTVVGRTAEYHRKQIREALGFRPSTVADERALAEWLAVEVCPVELVEARQREALLVEYRARQIEPPGRTRVEKVLVAARGKWEKTFCARTIGRLGEAGRPGCCPWSPRTVRRVLPCWPRSSATRARSAWIPCSRRSPSSTTCASSGLPEGLFADCTGEPLSLGVALRVAQRLVDAMPEGVCASQLVSQVRARAVQIAQGLHLIGSQPVQLGELRKRSHGPSQEVAAHGIGARVITTLAHATSPAACRG